jgi:hypothetical protein
MLDEGLLAPDQQLYLDRMQFQYGEGVLQQFSHLTHLSVVNCCKMVVATSDNMCADTLHALAGNERVARLFAAGCTHSRLTDNFDTPPTGRPAPVGRRHVLAGDVCQLRGGDCPHLIRQLHHGPRLQPALATPPYHSFQPSCAGIVF